MPLAAVCAASRANEVGARTRRRRLKEFGEGGGGRIADRTTPRGV